MSAARALEHPLILPESLRGVNIEVKADRPITEEELLEFCAENEHLRIEQDKNGKLIIMPPVDLEGGTREGIAYAYLSAWWLSYQKGRILSPSTGFKLPDSSTRASDGSWVSDERLNRLQAEDWKRFPRLAPDFVIEVRSSSDRIGKLKKKMTDTWIANGVRLAWLIDPLQEKAWIYREDGTEEAINGFDYVLSGEGVCPGLTLDLAKIRL